jgi:hypothetical protein
MCKARCITHQGKVISATGVHNHLPHMTNKSQEIPVGHTPNLCNPVTMNEYLVSNNNNNNNHNSAPSSSHHMMMHQYNYLHPLNQQHMLHDNHAQMQLSTNIQSLSPGLGSNYKMEHI